MVATVYFSADREKMYKNFCTLHAIQRPFYPHRTGSKYIRPINYVFNMKKCIVWSPRKIPVGNSNDELWYINHFYAS